VATKDSRPKPAFDRTQAFGAITAVLLAGCALSAALAHIVPESSSGLHAAGIGFAVTALTLALAYRWIGKPALEARRARSMRDGGDPSGGRSGAVVKLNRLTAITPATRSADGPGFVHGTDGERAGALNAALQP
jgi:hypothetical protein